MALRFLLGKNKSNNKPHIINVDDDGILKVITNIKYNFKKLREDGYCYMVNHHKKDRKTFTNLLIHNPGNYNIYVYDININMSKPNNPSNLISDITLSTTNIYDYSGNKLDHSSLLFNNKIDNDNIVYSNVKYDLPCKDIYKHSFVLDSNYNHNIDLSEYIEIKPNNGLIIKLNFHDSDSVYNINVKFIKVPI